MTEEFNVGRILFCTFGKYEGEEVEIVRRHNIYCPTLYTCRVLADDKEIALFHNELKE